MLEEMRVIEVFGEKPVERYRINLYQASPKQRDYFLGKFLRLEEGNCLPARISGSETIYSLPIIEAFRFPQDNRIVYITQNSTFILEARGVNLTDYLA